MNPTTGLPRRVEAVCSTCGATYPPELVAEHERHPYHVMREEVPGRAALLALRLERDPEIVTESELRLMDGNR